MAKPKVSGLLIRIAAVAGAACLCAGAAWVAAYVVERRSVADLDAALPSPEFDFVTVSADGLLVTLSGTAPDEATRFRAVSLAGDQIAPDRIIDRMGVTDTTALEPLKFSVEMLRNGDGIQLIGLIPAATGRGRVLDAVEGLTENARITDMLETADHPVPEHWEAALSFALGALRDLPRSKISVAADQISVEALARSPTEKTRIETALTRAAPEGVRLVLDIAAPRPVIAPFTLRFSIVDGTPRFDACSADTEEARTRILAAANAAGLTGKITCTIGLGAPSPRWAEAVETGLAALKELGAGTITFSDTDVSLLGTETLDKATFDRVAGELEADLPDVFSLKTVLPRPPETDSDTANEVPEFVATLSPEGLVQLRGRLADEVQRNAVTSYAQSLFGSDDVYSAARAEDGGLPDAWPVRVLAGLEALGQLANGTLIVQPDVISLRGVTGNAEANAEVARILSAKLGGTEELQLDIRYDEALDPVAALPTPEECATKVNAVQADRKITFDPGSATITAGAAPILDDIADILRTCESVRMEIAGYTDSQGREEMNLGLSQSRAEAVLTALLDRRVLTSNLVAKGYGEADPIADNGTEEGREANRRIEFRIVLDEPDPAEPDTTEPDAGTESPAAEGEAPAEDAPATGTDQ